MPDRKCAFTSCTPSKTCTFKRAPKSAVPLSCCSVLRAYKLKIYGEDRLKGAYELKAHMFETIYP